MTSLANSLCGIGNLFSKFVNFSEIACLSYNCKSIWWSKTVCDHGYFANAIGKFDKSLYSS